MALIAFVLFLLLFLLFLVIMCASIAAAFEALLEKRKMAKMTPLERRAYQLERERRKQVPWSTLP